MHLYELTLGMIKKNNKVIIHCLWINNNISNYI